MQPPLLKGISRPARKGWMPPSQPVAGGSLSVLCVDEDVYVTDLLRYALTREGYGVEIACSGREALHYAQKAQPDVVLLEASLPDADGFQLCAHFRSVLRIPVLIVSMRHSEDDIILGLAQGADDYIVKPFSMRVLMFRLQAVLRRLHAQPPVPRGAKRSYRVGHGWFDTERDELVAGAESVKLTPTQARILYLLITHEGRVLSAERMIELLWAYDSDTTGAVIKTHIRHLRAKIAGVLGEDVQVIQTIPGAGYTFRQVEPRKAPLSAHV
jgi:DNA-binding response OmpR family regulator